ncbi:hypothetical protein [Micromonospora costi]|uniref:Uncharacterized protein n=1 Tax=Micromonospora costi TaxID=1530042 RepID=A0A3B0A6D9_9ACTN|nr:hypothetical protein [Micromonospora costi]RKN55900.1 hypothetical protein D7193_15020 [Micromonospora costi]
MKTCLPPGLSFLDTVVVPRTATAGSAFHRPGALPHIAGCGQEQIELTWPELAALAIGMGCRPCPVCWPQPAETTGQGAPRLRPAAPWPTNGTGHQSRLGRTYESPSAPRPAFPSAA